MALRGEVPSGPALRLRTATVTAYTAGAATITLGGASVPGVPSLQAVAAGDVVQVLQQGPTLLVLGRVAS